MPPYNWPTYHSPFHLNHCLVWLPIINPPRPILPRLPMSSPSEPLPPPPTPTLFYPSSKSIVIIDINRKTKYRCLFVWQLHNPLRCFLHSWARIVHVTLQVNQLPPPPPRPVDQAPFIYTWMIIRLEPAHKIPVYVTQPRNMQWSEDAIPFVCGDIRTSA